MRRYKKSEKIAFTGTLVSFILLLLLLLFVFLPGNKPEEEGMMVSFGEFENGAGSETEPKSVTASSASASNPNPSNEDYLTQEDLSVSMNNKKVSSQVNTQMKLDPKLREAELKQQRDESLRAQREKEAVEKANQMDGLFGNQSGAGQGTTTGSEVKGNPAGKGNQDGNSWSLNGRNLAGRLAIPEYNSAVEGVITIQIKVDNDGSVVGATVGKPTTISEQVLRNAALSAAKRTQFTAGSSVAIGSITYYFKNH